MPFSRKLIDWYLQHQRDLPWRQTKDPYKIWLSEIILQQTRVAQGLPYYQDFVRLFPSVFDLAKANEEQVLKTWQGLGYYSRARNLHHTAKHITESLDGAFPDNYTDLLKLKGVGSYTAAAIASFAYEEPVAVLDGNVYRVLSRYFGIETDISSHAAKKEFQSLANQLIDPDRPSLFNQAIMEFGAIHCTPKKPDCTNCIYNESCVALQNHQVNKLPIKLKKTKITDRHLHYLVFLDVENNTIIEKRTGKGIWKNLYDFPLLELDNEAEETEVLKKIHDLYSKTHQIKTIGLFDEKKIIHKLSHQNLHIWFWKIKLKKAIIKGVSLADISSYPFPIVLHNFIENSLLTRQKTISLK